MIVKVVIPDSIYARVYFARGEQGAQGPTGNTGPQGPSGIVNVDSPITNSGTSTAANIGINQALLQIAPAQVTGTAVITTDSRLSDQRVPTDGSVTDTKIVAGGLSPNRITGTAVITTDSRLSDARTPTAHAASHGSAGSDPVTLAQSQVTGLTSALAAKAPLDSPVFTTKVTIPFSSTFLQSTGTGELRAVASAPGLGYIPYTASVTTGIAWLDSALLTRDDQANTFTVGGHIVANNASGTIPWIIRGAASQTADLLKIQNSSSVDLVRVDSAGRGIFPTILAGALTASIGVQMAVQPTSATIPGFAVRGAASQSANLQEWQNSAGTILGRMDASGNLIGTTIRTLGLATQIGEQNSGSFMLYTKATAQVASPGAGKASLYFRDGTNANTLKLVVRAGAAGAETTILDNIPT